jgi:hypothetical protein
LKNDVNVPSKRNKQKKISIKLVFVGILKVNDENSRIRIHTNMSWIRSNVLIKGYIFGRRSAIHAAQTDTFFLSAQV